MASDEQANGREGAGTAPRVLVVDDEPRITSSFRRVLAAQGFEVTVANDGREALATARAGAFDAIVSDIAMPGVDGLAFLRGVRTHDLDVPFVFVTGNPDVESAIEAIRYGAFRYLLKPVSAEGLCDVVTRAVRWRRLALVRREAAGEIEGREIGDLAGLDARFASATEKLWVAMQPIVSWGARMVLAYEALVRTDEPTMRNPAELFDAAERLGRVGALGRAIRARVAALVPQAPESALMFVNLHASDLDDEELLSAGGPLTAFAGRVVLEITERATLDGVRAPRERVARLRELGYRIAVDDLGAGYAGLSSFAALEPDIVKVDMSLVRGIDGSALKRKLVGSIASLCGDLGIQLVAEGVETEAERDCVASLGADALQGYLFARPGRGFPEPRF